MAAWDPPLDSELADGKPGKPSQARRIRDLPAALAELATGSPTINTVGARSIIKGFGPILGTGKQALTGSWIVPDEVYRLYVYVLGGGGAGGSGDNIGGSNQKGGGGGGAGTSQFGVLEVTPWQVFSTTIGAGGDPSLISPYVDTSLDGFQIGDGARTTFGNIVSAGGKRGSTGTAGGAGGAGGGTVDDQLPYSLIFGADGAAAYMTDIFGEGPLRSGRGGASLRGGGASGRSSVGVGYAAVVPGSGGGGGHPQAGASGSKIGGVGADGLVIVRY